MLLADPAPAAEQKGPGHGQGSTEDVSLDEEEAEENDQEEGDGQRTCDLVERHLEAVFHEIAGSTVLAVGKKGQNVDQDVHVAGCPSYGAEDFNRGA